MPANLKKRLRQADRSHKAKRLERERLEAKRNRAAMLDRLADAELQHGHHVAAERLAWRAEELREDAR